MNVYVRELSSALARIGVACEVYTRRESPQQLDVVDVEPGFRVHHVDAGPIGPVPKGQLHRYVDEFARRVERDILDQQARGEDPVQAIHANYWLSGVAGHWLKHRLDLPLVSTFHTLDRVKAEASPEEIDPSDPERRARAEAEVIGCSDAVLASSNVEADQIVDLYDADATRVEIIAPGVDHAFFSPGNKVQARRALGLSTSDPLLLFVGRIQPLKGADVAVAALKALTEDGGLGDAELVIVGGPSGPRGDAEVRALHDLVARLRLEDNVRFVPPQRHELLSTFYRAADCCLVPSMSESFGLVALEAAACATPVVASAVGGLTTLVVDGVTGYLVEARDVDGFAARCSLVLSDSELAVQLGVAAAERARTYTWSVAAHKLRALYGSLTERALAQC
jgi:D-inositol-3-phosphate glycosyltransferase